MERNLVLLDKDKNNTDSSGANVDLSDTSAIQVAQTTTTLSNEKITKQSLETSENSNIQTQQSSSASIDQNSNEQITNQDTPQFITDNEALNLDIKQSPQNKVNNVSVENKEIKHLDNDETEPDNVDEQEKVAVENKTTKNQDKLLNFDYYVPTEKHSKLHIILSVISVSTRIFFTGLINFNWIYIYSRYRGIIIGLLLTFGFLFYTLIAQISVVSPGQGVVTGGDDKIQIVSPTSGYIEDFDLTTGQTVNQDQVLYSFLNLDTFYNEKSTSNIIEINKKELERLKIDLSLLLSLTSDGLLDEINNIVNNQVTIGNQANELNKQQIIKPENADKNEKEDNQSIPNMDANKISADDFSSSEKDPQNIKSDTKISQAQNTKSAKDEKSEKTLTNKIDDIAQQQSHNHPPISSLPENLSLLLGNQELISLNDMQITVPKNQQEVDLLIARARAEDLSLNYFKFEVDLKALEDQINAFRVRTALFEQEKSAFSNQLELLLRKADLLVRSRSPEVDIIANNSEISRTRLSIINAESSYLDLSNRLKESERGYYSQLQQRVQEIYERIQALSKETSEKVGELNLLREKILQSSVRSPVDGQVLTIEKNLTLGSFIEANQVIMTIKRNLESAIIKARIEARYRPFIDVDGAVEIVIDSPGFRRSFMGKISKISVDSFTLNNNNNAKQLAEQRFYDVDITPDNADDVQNLYEGIPSRVYVQSKEISIFSYITALFNTNLVFNIW